ncbi:hypothetical protein F4801DRAFT_260419 [Xylaria longipes]|nr:hypothetical protein F4801DRAFT_260419 [Xylaria longipes]
MQQRTRTSEYRTSSHGTGIPSPGRRSQEPMTLERRSRDEGNNKACGNSGSNLPFTCPFVKRYAFRSYACGWSKFKKISDVVQHLRRTHYPGVNFNCSICGSNFKTSSGRNSHTREQQGLKRDFESGHMTTEQLDEVKTISSDRSMARNQK